ncbi:MAG: sugar/nucleoside kinase (ribokinase family) [Candidatus Latescibacterota bacterium]|jgi:sugar/nucleoside kinase (ribokinase family)
MIEEGISMGSTYDVYGVGNALVDIQYKVTPETLGELGIEKGVMTLIDMERQQALFAALEQDPVASASGGSAANTMIGIAQFGGSAFYACLTGRDAWGDFYQRDLEKAGVATSADSRGEGITGQCVVFITPDADRTLNTFLGISSAFGPAQLEAEKIAASQYTYIEGYLLSSDNGYEACRETQRIARESGTAVSLTLSDPFMVSAFKERFESLVEEGVDLLFCNEDEAFAFSGINERQAAVQALGQRAAIACVTCGADGALIAENGHIHSIPGVRVTPVDTNGAGDLFAGGVLYGLTHDLGVENAGKLGSYAAAQVVSQYGPRLEHSLQEVEAILAHFA